MGLSEISFPCREMLAAAGNKTDESCEAETKQKGCKTKGMSKMLISFNGSELAESFAHSL